PFESLEAILPNRVRTIGTTDCDTKRQAKANQGEESHLRCHFFSPNMVCLQLIPVRALDNDSIEWIKISESKNATTFTVAYDNSVAYVCVAIRKTLHIFEITHKKARYSCHHEIQMPVNIQTL